MRAAAPLLGALLLLLAGVDLVKTTLSTVSPGGPVSVRLAAGLWRGLLRLHRRRSAASLLEGFGVGVLVLTVANWILLTWSGWTLIFLGSPGAVVRATTGAPSGFWDRAYFAGYSLATLGLGDFRPVGPLWQMLTVGVALSGLVLVTLAISYLVGVTNAATERRQLAGRVATLGGTPARIVTQSWDGDRFSSLAGAISSLTGDLQLLDQRHLAYPVLHYQRAQRPRESAPVRIAALDEAFTLLAFGVAPEHRPAPSLLEPAQQAVAAFLETLHDVFLSPAPEPPPAPSLQPLREAAIPTVSEEVFAQRVANLASRRRLLAGLVLHGGWDWDDVQREAATSGPEDETR